MQLSLGLELLILLSQPPEGQDYRHATMTGCLIKYTSRRDSPKQNLFVFRQLLSQIHFFKLQKTNEHLLNMDFFAPAKHFFRCYNHWVIHISDSRAVSVGPSRRPLSSSGVDWVSRAEQHTSCVHFSVSWPSKFTGNNSSSLVSQGMWRTGTTEDSWLDP